MKRIIIFLSMALFLSLGINAQTLSTTTFSDANGNMPTVGSNFDVPVNVTSIGTVLTLTVYLQFDTTAITYTGYDTVNSEPHAQVREFLPGLIKVICGNFPNQITISDGLLVDLNFDFKGGYTQLRFGTVENPTNGYKCNILPTNYVPFNFPEANVTHGAVEGFFDNAISSGDWNDAANWSLGKVPDEHHNVKVMANGSSKGEVTLASDATINNLTICAGGQLSVSSNLTVNGNLLVKSDNSGDGSFVYKGGSVSVAGETTVQRYITAGQWHGISAPVNGATFASTYIPGVDTWVKSYDESTDSYTYLTDTNAVMADMTGYFTWIAGSAGQTFSYTGALNTGSVSSNLVRTGKGFNFVGNPFPSAIDWDATSGWTKTNVDNAIWLYDGTNWLTYVNGAGTGSNQIALGQGFFVRVSSGNNSGSLAMTPDVAVHNTSGFVKLDQKIVKVQLEANQNSDIAVIRFTDEATTGYDGNLDAAKLFSFDVNYPQIYTVAGEDLMAVNSLPYSESFSVLMDVTGKNGDIMTISLPESSDIPYITLIDKFTGATVDLTSGDYTFTYDNTVSDRFNLLFGVTGVSNPSESNNINIFAVNKSVKINGLNNIANIMVYNLLGQKVTSLKVTGSEATINLEETGFYLVKVDDGMKVTTRKILIK